MSRELTAVVHNGEKLNPDVWDAIVDTLSLTPDYDKPGAVRIADEIQRLVLVGLSEQSEERRARRRARMGDLLRGLAWTFTGAVALAAIAWGAYSWTTHNDHDYAGYGPSKAPVHASVAIRAYYGENDLPANLRLVGETRSSVFGQHAWKVDYRAQDGTAVCAWVWIGKPTPDTTETDQAKVAAGGDCR